MLLMVKKCLTSCIYYGYTKNQTYNIKVAFDLVYMYMICVPFEKHWGVTAIEIVKIFIQVITQYREILTALYILMPHGFISYVEITCTYFI